MSSSRVVFLARGVFPRVSSAIGSSRNSSRKSPGLLHAPPLTSRAARAPAACSLSASFSPFLRPSALRVLAALPHAHPAAAFFPAAAAAAAAPAAARLLSSSSNGAAAAGSSSTTASTTAAAAGDGLSEAAGVEGEGLETRAFKNEASDPPGGDQLQKLKSQLHETREALEAANAKVRELQDKLLRALAEQENARVRITKEVAGAREYAISGFAKALLDVGDSLTSATEQLQQQMEKQQENIQKNELKTFVEGIALTENLFHKTLERFGVLKYNPMGEKFDPALHEALFEMEGPTEKNGSVAQVVQSGYKIKDRVLRAAKVGVVKGQ